MRISLKIQHFCLDVGEADVMVVNLVFVKLAPLEEVLDVGRRKNRIHTFVTRPEHLKLITIHIRDFNLH